MATDLQCCPDLTDGKKCDYLDFVYRLTHQTEVATATHRQVVPVEVAIHVRLQRCTGPLQLGNVVYSTTLLPGEKVRLFTSDRRSRFSYDSESEMTYRHESKAEEQYYMDSFEGFMSNLESRDKTHTSDTATGSASTHGSTSGFFETLFSGPSVSVSGNFNSQSTHDFLRELNVHAESSHNRSMNMTREASSISIGEVQTKQHAEGESESHVESSSRMFENKNRCHAVTYIFYQLNKEQTIRFSLQAIQLRVSDPAGDSSIRANPIKGDDKVSVLPTGILATSDKLRTAQAAPAQMQLLYLQQPQTLASSRTISTNASPIDPDVQKQAIANVTQSLNTQGILDKDGKVDKKLLASIEFTFKTTIPTPGVIVKGCLDECNVCEPNLQSLIGLELDNQKLRNDLLQKQIELLEKSQEYRCCPVGEAEEETA